MATRVSYNIHARDLLALGLPLVGGNVAQQMIGITDTLMLGWYDVEALAAVALAGSYFFVLYLLGCGFGWAASPLVAAAQAEDDEMTIRRVTRMAIWLSLVFVLLTVPLNWHSATVLEWLGQSPDIAALAQDYLRVFAPAMLPMLLFNVIKSYLAGLGRTKIVFAITLAAVFINAAANYALIFGYWGFPELGVRGAAIASTVTHSAMLAGLLAYALRIYPHHRLWQRVWKPDWLILDRVGRLGLPIGIATLAESSMFTASALMMGWLGTVPLAAHGIVAQVASAGFILHLGFASAATVRAGRGVGLRDRDYVARGARVAMILSLAISVVTVALYVAMPERLVGLFLAQDEPLRDAIISYGAVLILMAAAFQLVDGLQAVMVSLLRGLQDTAVPMVLAGFSYWGIGMTSSYLLGFTLGWGGIGVWAGLTLGLTAAALLLSWRFWRHMLNRVGVSPSTEPSSASAR